MPPQTGNANEIVRSVVLEADRDAVWRAISSDDGLAGWLAETASVDLRPGGIGVVGFAGGHARRLRVDAVELREAISFRWSPEAAPEDETRVELRLEDAGDGATRLTVVESGFAAAGPQARGRAAATAWAWEAALALLAVLVVLVTAL